MFAYWLADKDYDKAPAKRHHDSNLGTDPPISNAWTSPWIGSKVEDVAKWLQNKPNKVDLDSNHFAVLDVRAVDQSVIVCKIGDVNLHGDSLSTIRYPARDSSNFLLSMTAFRWENKFEGVGGEKNHAEIDYGGSE